MITLKGITLLERNKLLPFSRVLFLFSSSLSPTIPTVTAVQSKTPRADV